MCAEKECNIVVAISTEAVILSILNFLYNSIDSSNSTFINAPVECSHYYFTYFMLKVMLQLLIESYSNCC